MDEITLLAKSGSREEPYSVVFTITDDRLMVWCDCRAGEFGQVCKHKMGLINNQKSMLYDPGQIDELGRAIKWVNASGLPDVLQELKVVEDELEGAKKRLKTVKQKTARLMKEGV